MSDEEQSSTEKPFVTAYGDGGFRVLGERIEGSIFITPEEAQPWSVTAADGLASMDMSPFLALKGRVDVLLIGAGDTHFPPVKALTEALMDIGISVDFMSTGSACRTFNVLQSDGRQVACALIAVE